jgi:hypothetical protein
VTNHFDGVATLVMTMATTTAEDGYCSVEPSFMFRQRKAHKDNFAVGLLRFLSRLVTCSFSTTSRITQHMPIYFSWTGG